MSKEKTVKMLVFASAQRRRFGAKDVQDAVDVPERAATNMVRTGTGKAKAKKDQERLEKAVQDAADAERATAGPDLDEG